MNSKELILKCYEPYKEQKYEEAYNILIDNKAFFVKDSTLYNFLFTLASRLNRIDEALFYLNEAIVRYEMWYRTGYLDSETDLDPIRNLKDYKKLYNINKQRELDCRYSGDKKIDIYVPKAETKNLFFMLHGNSQFVELVKNTFNSKTINDHIIALPQSREFKSYLSYTWSDIDFGLKVVNEHYKEIIAEHNIQEESIILASYTTGAQVILKGLLENKLTAKKVIFLSPWIPNLEDFEKQIYLLKEQKVKVFVECGADDSHCLPIANHFVELLSKYNVDHTYKIIKGLSTAFPPNTKEVFDEALAYFKNKN